MRKDVGGTSYVYPTYHKYEDGKTLKEFVQNGNKIFANVDLVKVKPLGPYFIKETSFMPSESFKFFFFYYFIVKFCKKGYKWAEVDEYLTSKYTIPISLTQFNTCCQYKLLSWW